MRKLIISTALTVATLGASWPLGVYGAAPLFDYLGTEVVSGVAVDEPSDDEPGFDCRRHGNRRCGPPPVAPGGQLPAGLIK